MQQFFSDENWFDFVLMFMTFFLIYRPELDQFKIHLPKWHRFFKQCLEHTGSKTGLEHAIKIKLEECQICEGPVAHHHPKFW